MIRDFSKEELEAAESERDTEFTLGGGTAASLLAAGFCFSAWSVLALDTRVGHRSSSESATAVSPPSEFEDSITAQSGQGPSPVRQGSAGRSVRLTQTATGCSGCSSGNSDAVQHQCCPPRPAKRRLNRRPM